MTLTEDMAEAFRLIEETNECLFITGKAGTGKTTFLKFIVEHTKKNFIVTASTGIAAINAGGCTLHRIFNIPFGIQDPNAVMKGFIKPERIAMFRALDILIIDEISMVRPDVIDYIDRKLKLYRMNKEPFGGVQVVMFGDLYQLPPVVKKAEQDILLQFYRGPYFFYANVWRAHSFRIIELSKIFRQQDEEFISILNDIRNFILTNKDINELDTLRDYRASKIYDNGHIHICSHRRDVDKINAEMLGEATHTFPASVTGDIKPDSVPCAMELKLREGARIMMLINDPEGEYYNGSMGTVKAISDKCITVDLDETGIVDVEPYSWKAIDYSIKDKKIISEEKGACTQFPIALAWAITIHKSQGLTFDKVTLHAGHIFCSGQLYVALSRCRSLDGIITDCFLDKKHIIPNPELVAFEEAYKKAGNIFNVNTYHSMRLR